MDPVLIIHTTEGTTMAGAKAAMDRNRSWSNWLCDPATKEFADLIGPGRPGRSLRNIAGGVETNNRGGVFQLEVVGKAKAVENYSDQWYENLAEVITTLCIAHRIPRRFPFPFYGEQQAFGTRAKSRISNTQWLAASGILGHQHVPENTHWDPGQLEVTRLTRFMSLTNTGADPVSPTTPDLVAQAQRVLIANGADLGDSGPNNDGVDGQFGRLTLAGVTSVIDDRNATIGHQTAHIANLEATVEHLTVLNNNLSAGETAELERLNQELGMANTQKADLERDLKAANDEIERLLGGADDEDVTGLAELGRQVATLVADAGRFTEQ